MRYKSGFSIVEILVVIVIIGVIMAVGSVGFRDFSKRQIVVNVKRQILSDIRAAQSDATSGRKPAGCGENHTLAGYAFEVTGTSNPPSYRTFAICTIGSVVQTFTTKQINLTRDVTLTVNFSSQPSPPNVLVFKPLAQGTNLPSGSRLEIGITSAINNELIRVDASGTIR